MTDELSEAWDALYAALPVGFVVGRPLNGDEVAERPWHVVATDLRSNALRKEYVEATGWTEDEALREPSRPPKGVERRALARYSPDSSSVEAAAAFFFTESVPFFAAAFVV